ncbi:MAG: hypothetical protein HYY24_21460 [Verrucomicrobia bacterium]|nr:hypothetical protein [Verrucomicrobiota bacterium]
MAGPISLSVSAVALAKGEAERFFKEHLERWRESPIDPATGLPRNHVLARCLTARGRTA